MFTKITSHGDPDMLPSFSPARSANPGPSAAEMVAIHANSRIGRSAISQPTRPSLEQLLLARGAAGLGDILEAREAAGLTESWIGQVLLARGAVSEAEMLVEVDVLAAEAEQVHVICTRITLLNTDLGGGEGGLV